MTVDKKELEQAVQEEITRINHERAYLGGMAHKKKYGRNFYSKMGKLSAIKRKEKKT